MTIPFMPWHFDDWIGRSVLINSGMIINPYMLPLLVSSFTNKNPIIQLISFIALGSKTKLISLDRIIFGFPTSKKWITFHKKVSSHINSKKIWVTKLYHAFDINAISITIRFS